jgi:hypothetical protein
MDDKDEQIGALEEEVKTLRKEIDEMVDHLKEVERAAKALYDMI